MKLIALTDLKISAFLDFTVCKIPSRIPKYINISESKRMFLCNFWENAHHGKRLPCILQTSLKNTQFLRCKIHTSHVTEFKILLVSTGPSMKLMPLLDLKVKAFLVIYRLVCRMQTAGWLEISHMFIFYQDMPLKNFKIIQLVEADIWKLIIVLLASDSEKCWHHQWSYHKITNCVRKGV